MRASDFKDIKRATDIYGIFRMHLGRDPDDEGWTHYYESSHTIQEINGIIEASEEAVIRKMAKAASKVFHVSNIQQQLTVSGAPSPGWERYLRDKMGFTTIVNLSRGMSGYDTSVFNAHLTIPVSKTDPLPLQSGVLFSRFVHEALSQGESVLVHSRVGLVRPSTMCALYRSVELNLDFEEELQRICAETGSDIALDQTFIDSQLADIIKKDYQ